MEKFYRLKEKKRIDRLFLDGKWSHYKDLKIIVLQDNEPGIYIGVSVGKRFMKRAVDRNRVKRLLREAYRENSSIVRETFGENFCLMIFWASSTMPNKMHDVSGFLQAQLQKIKQNLNPPKV